jgi:HPt (histidine-containing phosphotransfer) domain-containing protein
MPPHDEPPSDRGELIAIWEEHRPTTLARVEALQRAVGLVAAGRLGDSERRKAGREAHTLAGSVSFFGYEEATRIALELESIFEGSARADPDRLQEMVARLRGELERLPYTS